MSKGQYFFYLFFVDDIAQITQNLIKNKADISTEIDLLPL